MICATPPTMPVRNRTSESTGDGLIQPHGIEASEASVAISENEKTSEAVLSVALMWRTCVMAAAVRKAPATANNAPAAPAASRSTPNRCGDSITMTPMKPTATAVQRKTRTFTPRKTAASATLINGVAKPIAVTATSGSRASAANMQTMAVTPVSPRRTWPNGFFVRTALASSLRQTSIATSGISAKKERAKICSPSGTRSPMKRTSAPITVKEKVAPSCSAMPRKTFIAGLASWIGASNFPNRLLLSAFVSRRRDALQQRKRHRRRNRCDQQAQLFACGAADRAPNPLRRRRHVDVGDPEAAIERVDDGVDDGGAGADGAGLARALEAERIGLARHVAAFERVGRRVIGARDGVIHEARGEQLAV